MAAKLGIIERLDTPLEYSSILLKLLMASQFLLLWVNPEIDQAQKINGLAVIMAFEFVMVHSGLVMAIMPAKNSLLVVAFPIYGLFALTMNLSVPNNVVLFTYLVVVFNRMRFAFFNVNEFKKTQLKVKS